MSNVFLRDFALGMNQEVNTLGTIAMNDAMTFPQYGQPPAQEQQPPAQQAPPPVVQQTPSNIDYIKQNTTGEASSYDTLFGNAEQPGGPFEGVKVTDMTIGEAINFTDPRGPYAAHVRDQVGRTATPIGRFQVVGSTLKDVVKDLGLSPDTKMTPEVQDRIAERIYEKQGPQAWEAWGGGEGSDTAYGGSDSDQLQDGFPTSRGTVDVSELEENAPDLSPKAQRRRKIGMVLSGLGVGFGQMSRGQQVDLTNVFEDYLDRQEEMRERISEISMERRRQEERLEGRAWEREDIATAEEQQQAAERRAETRVIAGEEREVDRAERERERISQATSSAYEIMYPDADWVKDGTFDTLAKIDPAFAGKFAEKKVAEGQEAETLAQNVELYTAAGRPDLALLARTDPEEAAKAYTKGVDPTDAMLNGAILQKGGPAAEGVALALRLPSGILDPREKGLIDVELGDFKALAEKSTQLKSRISQLKLALTYAADPNLDQGKFQEAIMPIKQYLATLPGVVDVDKLSKQEAFKAVNEGLVAHMRIPGDIISDQDVKRYRSSVSQLGNTREGNLATLAAQIETARREDEYIAARTAWFQDKKHDLGDVQGKQEFIREYMEQQDATGDIFLNLGDTSPKMEDRVTRAYNEGRLTEGSVVYVGEEIVFVDAEMMAELDAAIRNPVK